MIYGIFAIGENGVMGDFNSLPWGREAKSDLRHFMEFTHNKIVVMGKNTFESVGPLPGRRILVLTKDKAYRYVSYDPSVKIVHSKEDVYKFVVSQSEKDVVIAGGPGLIESFIDDIQIIKLTVIQGEDQFDGSHYLAQPFSAYGFDLHSLDRIETEPDTKIRQTFYTLKRGVMNK
ncbi:dihydrofolate reductase [Enterococcus faecalis]|nr:dihydrofolate reductase [Enterococcus faecalis]